MEWVPCGYGSPTVHMHTKLSTLHILINRRSGLSIPEAKSTILPMSVDQSASPILKSAGRVVPFEFAAVGQSPGCPNLVTLSSFLKEMLGEVKVCSMIFFSG